MVRRAVVVGSGSAGRRHAAMLRALEPELEITVVRRGGASVLADRHLPPRVSVVSTLEEALAASPEVGVVAGPAPLHAAAARQLLDAGVTTLVEKPVAATLEDAVTLGRHASARERVLVGYHLRFSDVAPELHRLVRSGCVGEPAGFHFEVGQHLSGWRPDIDPRRSVSACCELGGGVLLELSHELDAVRFVLDTEVVEVTEARLRHDGAPTDGVVETVADLQLRTSDEIRGSVHLDMTSEPARRRWRITGTDATLSADLLTSTISLEPHGKDRYVVATIEPGERDRAEERLIRHLIELSDGDVRPDCTLADGIAALEIVDAARRSADSSAPAAVRRCDRSDS